MDAHAQPQPLKSRLQSKAAFSAIVVATIIGGAVVAMNWPEIKQFLKGTCASLLGADACESRTLKSIAGAYIWAFFALPVALILERIIPAKPQQPLLSVGLRQDIVWFIFFKICQVTFIAAFSLFLYGIYDNYLSVLRIGAIHQLPVAAQIVIVILLSDFIGWFHHWVRHKVPLFWEFHKIHHSQREMNYFCDYRIHPVDALIARTIGFIPFYSLDLDIAIPTFVAWEVIRIWYTNFTHANLKTNYGWLRYFLVTPQSHRIHHSIEERHFDKNFAVVFSIWDFIFKTQHLDFDDYPDTGIPDEAYPNEEDGRPVALLSTIAKQLWFPFRIFFPSANKK